MKRTPKILTALLALALPLTAHAEISAEKPDDYLYFLQLDTYNRQTMMDAPTAGITGGLCGMV